MAPNTSGSGDHYPSVELCRHVLRLCPGVLRPGGSLAMKVFEGELYPDLLGEAGALFERVKGFKPRACRDVSREIYVIAEGLRASPGGRVDE
jgi:23S rRNA (uridine2552-2'-O)-methyltransferase